MSCRVPKAASGIKNLLRENTAFRQRNLSTSRILRNDHQESNNNRQQSKNGIPFVKLTLVAGTAGLAAWGYSLSNRLEDDTQTASDMEVAALKQIPIRAQSRLFGKLNAIEIPEFLRPTILAWYIRTYGVNVEEAEHSLDHYKCLGQLFTRRLKPGSRPIDSKADMVSPVDGRVMSFGEVTTNVVSQVKGVSYPIDEFLRTNEHTPRILAEPRPTTTAKKGNKKGKEQEPETPSEISGLLSNPKNKLYQCVIYLAPGDYHAYHSPANWTVEDRRHISGAMFPVKPTVARFIPGLFALNERVVLTGRWSQGFFSYVAVAAHNVGNMTLDFDPELATNKPCDGPAKLRSPEKAHPRFLDVEASDLKVFQNAVKLDKGQSVGWFRLGSTIVLIFEASPGFEFSVNKGEKIKMGQPLGQLKQRK